MFDKNNPQNYQARGNVAALGRVNANDSTDHGNFNGISKTVNVKPDSELIINFTTMQTNSKQGATNLVIKDAKKNTELATVNVAKTGTAHLFKVPTDADRLDLEFIPDNTAVADASRITTNKDGYKYYSFIDNVGLFSGSHLYVKNRDLAPKATNNKEYTINTEIGNNGNFGASLKADQFKYEVTLPQGVTYVNDSLTTTFPNGNEDSTVLKNMTVNYDQNANKVTFTSQGVTTARGTHTKEVLFPDKSLKLSYKVNVANIDTPKNIDFNEKLTYRTASDVVINNAQPEVTLTADPFSVAVEMNKDALQQQVNSQVDDSHYTTASIAEYNKLKQQADTILNEDANHVETANRASQADIDGLVTKLQAALIDNQAAISELDAKAQEKVTAAQQSKKVTQDEVAALVTKINNDKNNAIAEINKQTTAQGVTTEKDNGIAVLEQDVITPTVKPQAKQDIIQAVTTRKQQIKKSNASLQDEKDVANDKIGKIETKAIKDIDAATTNAQVEAIKTKAINDINQTAPATTAKAAALEEFDEVVQAQIDQAPLNPDTTNEEVAEAIERINAATTTGDVTTAKDTAVQKVQQLHANPVKKPAGKTELDQAAADKKTQIEQTPNASQQEINDAKQEVDAALNQAKTNIDQSSTNEYVDNAVKEGKAKINAVKTFSEYKKDALAKIADAYNAKVNEADNSNASTSSEIAEAKQKLAELKQTADQNVNQATSKDDIEVQIHNDLDNINDYTIPTGKKESATTDLYAYADQKKNNILADTNATQDEKQQAIKQVDQNVQTALESINNGVDNSDVDDALTQGKATIDAVQVDATVKPKANQAIDAKAQETKESIDQSDQLTAEEKTAALATIKQITDQAKQGITDATTTAEVEKAKAQGLEAFDNIQIDSTEKQKAIEELETALDQIEAGVNVDADATTEEKEAFTNALEDILSKATEDISDQTTNAEIATVKNSALEQLKAQRINPVVKKNALEAIREVVNKQIEIIENADADASAKEIARTDLGRYFDRFADKLDKTQTNTEVDELQNVTIPAIEAIVPQKDPNANDTNSGSDNNDATANSNANATPENTGQPNVTESTDNANADTSSTTTNNHNDAATGGTTATSTDNSATGNGTSDKSEVESTNNGTTDKSATETDNATPAESARNNNSTTATNENAPTGSTATVPTTNASTGAASSADSKDNASVNDSKQNAEVNNSAESQSTNGKVAQPKSENKAKDEKDGRDSTNQSMVESTTETLPSADITEPKVPSNTEKDKKESTTNQTDAGQLKSETNVASNEADKSEGNVDTDVSNKPSTSKPSEAKDKATSTEDSQKADMATSDKKDNQAAIGATADVNNKATQNDGANASPATVSNGSNSANQDMLKVTNTDKHQAKATSAQQGKENKAKQQAKTLPDTGMSHNDDLPYVELALGAGMAFLIRRFTKKDQQTEE